MAKRPARYGKHYLDSEIALVFLVDRSDAAKEILAQLLERTEDAVDMIWRWMEDAGFPEGAENRIHRQIDRVRESLGEGRQGIVDLE